MFNTCLSRSQKLNLAGFFQKVYLDTGIKNDQRSVPLCRIKEGKDQQFGDNLTIRFDFKTM